MSEYFPKPKFLGANVKVKLYLSNATKADLKNTAGVDTSDFAKIKTDLAGLKSHVDKLYMINWKMYQLIQAIWKVK